MQINPSKLAIHLSKLSQSETALLTFSYLAKKGQTEETKVVNHDLAKKIHAAISDKCVSAKCGETTVYRELGFQGHRHVIVLGLGEKPTAEDLRQASASAISAIKSVSAKTVAVDWDNFPGGKKDNTNLLQAFAEGLILSSYSFDELKSKKAAKADNESLKLSIQTKLATDAKTKKALETATIVAETVNFSRRLGDLPGNLMTPTNLADAAVAAAKGTGIKVTVWDKARIKKENMGGLLGVSQGSSQEPRFIIMEYKGAAASKKPIAFVGKGLTFDCGGISIKPSAGMEEMKYDMCGGANVIGTILAIARLKLKINVVALIASTENLAGPSATKPGDVHTARNGKTFEVNNTDAEGRLILADALSYASELKPIAIFDAATLTGAMVMALGNIHTGYFTKNSEVKKRVEKAADVSGELVWNMPLVDHHAKDMKGTFADLSNISSGKGAGSATAAAFLEHFVEKDIPWAHFDIAGTGWATGNRVAYNPKKGASGAMIRTFVELAKSYV